MQTSILQDLSVIDLEKYYFILNCMETNSNEYLTIKKRLDKLIKSIEHQLDEQTRDRDNNVENCSSDECLTWDYDTEEQQNVENSEVDWQEFTNNGDILSNLMNLEKKNIFSSKKLYDFKSISVATRKRALIDLENNLSTKKSKGSLELLT